MFQKVLTIWGLPALATAAFLLTADPGLAAGQGSSYSRAGYSRGYNFYDRYRHQWGGSNPSYGAYYKTYPSFGSYYNSYPSYDSSPYDTSDWDSGSDLGSSSASSSAGTSSNGYSGTTYPVALGTNGTQSKNTVNITVRLPANADLWFEGTKTQSTGGVRKFQSPPLKSGRQYTYEVWARWNDNGRIVTQTRHLSVSRGDHLTVRFPVRSETTE